MKPVVMMVLPPNWTDAYAREHGYADRVEAVADALANGFGQEEWDAWRSGPQVRAFSA